MTDSATHRTSRAAATICMLLAMLLAATPGRAIILEGDTDHGRPAVTSSGHVYMPAAGSTTTTVAHTHTGGHQER